MYSSGSRIKDKYVIGNRQNNLYKTQGIKSEIEWNLEKSNEHFFLEGRREYIIETKRWKNKSIDETYINDSLTDEIPEN